MRATALSRIVAALATLALVGACSEDAASPGSLDLTATTRENMTVTPQSATIRAGQVVFLKARLTNQYGDQFEAAGVIWKSSNDAIAVVSGAGEVLGMSEGKAVISATVLGISQSSTIQVLPGTQGKEQKPNIEEGRL